LKTEAIYFSKHDKVVLQVPSSEIIFGATMRVLGVMIFSKLCWWSNITHFSNIVKKKKYTLGTISTDLNPSELLDFFHGSIYSVVYYAAATWLNGGLKENKSKDSKFSICQCWRLYFGRGEKNAVLWNCIVEQTR
jgi:hypothetical protein